MGIILYKKGDLLTAPKPVIAHSVNCQCVFGAGLAKQIAEKYPHAKNEYIEYCKSLREKYWKVPTGEILYTLIDKDRFLAHCFTQEFYGRGKDYNDYNAFYKVFTELCAFCERHEFKSIGIPRLGSGLAGGQWSKIEKILRRCIEYRPIEFHIYELPQTK